MKDLSRSEIEKSVKRSAKVEPRVFETEESNSTSFNPRKSVVLGGDLSGVRSVPKRNSYKWMIVAASVLVLSSLVFIVPELFRNSPKLKKIQQVEVSKDAVYQENILLEKKVDSSDLTQDIFTQSKDRDRAKEYRETDLVQEKVAEFKKQAESALRAGKYTKPSGESAYHYYQEILKLDSDNRFAKKGTTYLVRRLLSVGMNEVNNGELRKAQNSLASLMLIDDDSDSFTKLSDAVTELETEQQNKILREKNIEQSLSKAEEAFKRKRLTTPKEKSAVYYYNKVLEIDSDNAAAQQGIQQVIQYYSNSVNDKIEQENWRSAQENIEKIQTINKDAPEIQSLQSALSNAQKLSDQKTREADEAKKKEAQLASQVRLEKELEQERQQQLAQQAEQRRLAEIKQQNELRTAQSQTIASTAQSPLVQNNTSGSSLQNQDFSKGAPVEDITNTSRANLTSNNSALKSGLQSYYSSEYVGAFNTLKPLADSNNTRAQIRVGYMYQFGRGVPESTATASQYFNKALPNLRNFANQGNAWAQADLGSLYEDGIVVTQSYAEALKWYRKAAAKNYTGAQTNLGNMYFFGKGVQQSQEEAIRWYRLAAIGGDAIAKQNLVQLGAIDF